MPFSRSFLIKSAERPSLSLKGTTFVAFMVMYPLFDRTLWYVSRQSHFHRHFGGLERRQRNRTRRWHPARCAASNNRVFATGIKMSRSVRDVSSSDEPLNVFAVGALNAQGHRPFLFAPGFDDARETANARIYGDPRALGFLLSDWLHQPLPFCYFWCKISSATMPSRCGNLSRHMRNLHGLHELFLEIRFHRQFDVFHVTRHPVGFDPFFLVEQRRPASVTGGVADRKNLFDFAVREQAHDQRFFPVHVRSESARRS